jgi:hypothetical protein
VSLGEPTPALDHARRGLAIAEEHGFARLAEAAATVIDHANQRGAGTTEDEA